MTLAPGPGWRSSPRRCSPRPGGRPPAASGRVVVQGHLLELDVARPSVGPRGPRLPGRRRSPAARRRAPVRRRRQRHRRGELFCLASSTSVGSTSRPSSGDERVPTTIRAQAETPRVEHHGEPQEREEREAGENHGSMGHLASRSRCWSTRATATGRRPGVHDRRVQGVPVLHSLGLLHLLRAHALLGSSGRAPGASGSSRAQRLVLRGAAGAPADLLGVATSRSSGRTPSAAG